VLPSLINSGDEIKYFISKGRVNFPDEVELGIALGAVYNTQKPEKEKVQLPRIDKSSIRAIIENAEDGYLKPNECRDLFQAAGIPYVQEKIVQSEEEALLATEELGFPLVMKVIGPLHKSDVKGVTLNINSKKVVAREFDRLMGINGAQSVLMQSMHQGTELFIGAKAESNYGHLIFCGLGGIFIEVIGDVSSAFTPVSVKEANHMITSLAGYPIFEGLRGREPLNKEYFAELIRRISALTRLAPEIQELDLNPLLAYKDDIVAVDSRVKILK
jgi:acetyltransferase